MGNRKVRCFVAMAFGHKDCDRLYDKHVVPTLRAMDIEPVRVDRRQHKDDLNNYVIRMLKQADIALADLTYARPSVYYEAGFAERTISVVYTVRKDHLSKAQADDRLRVHFDLQMKKIVTWADGDDKTFAHRLKRRVRYLLGPILRDRARQAALEVDRQRFQVLSVHDRCERIREVFSGRLRSKRFWIKPFEEIFGRGRPEVGPSVGLVGVKQIGGTCHFCFVLASESISKKQIREALDRVTGTVLVGTGGGTKSFCDYYFFCALKGLPESRLTSSFPKAEPMYGRGEFRLKRRTPVFGPGGLVIIHMFPSIDSEARLGEYAREAAARFTNEKTNRYTRAVWEKYAPWPTIVFRRKK